MIFFRSCIMLLVVPLSATPTYADNLIDFYQLALSQDPEYRSAQAGYQATLESKHQVRAQLLPSVEFNAGVNLHDTEIISSALLPVATYDYRSDNYEVTLNQPLLNFDYFSQLRQVDFSVGVAKASLSAAEQTLIMRVTQHYFGLLSAIDDLNFVRAEKEAIDRQLKQTQQYFEVGLIAMTDVYESQAAFDLVVAQEIIAENRLAEEHEAMTEITGRYATSISPLAKETPLPGPKPADIRQWIDTALMQNFQLLAAELSYKQAHEEIKRQHAGYMPALSLVASYSYNDASDNQFSGTESRDQHIGIQLKVPLYAGGGTSSRKRQAHHLAEQSREAYVAQRRTTLRQTRNAYHRVLADIKTVNALVQAVVSAQASLDAIEAGYDVGTRTAVEVVSARRDLFRQQRDHVRARYNHILQTLRLKQAAGILNAVDVEQVNKWLIESEVPLPAELAHLSSYGGR